MLYSREGKHDIVLLFEGDFVLSNETKQLDLLHYSSLFARPASLFFPLHSTCFIIPSSSLDLLHYSPSSQLYLLHYSSSTQLDLLHYSPSSLRPVTIPPLHDLLHYSPRYTTRPASLPLHNSTCFTNPPSTLYHFFSLFMLHATKCESLCMK